MARRRILELMHPLASPAPPGGLRAALGAFFACGLFLWSSGCQHRPRTVDGPTPGIGMGQLPLPPMPKVATPNISSRIPDLRLEMSWLDLDEFIPPGATLVGPTTRPPTNLLPPSITRFPSMELCTSPDKHFVLFHDGMKRQKNQIYHWLMILKNGAPYPNVIFGTRTSFEASWASDSSCFAVTHFVGDNSSEVFVASATELARHSIEMKAFVEEYFPAHLGSAPMFIKAYRWTSDSKLLVRALARSRIEPYELFGCEVLVSLGAADTEPRTKFLRGFIKPQADASLVVTEENHL